jgi:hypothetical protein
LLLATDVTGRTVLIHTAFSWNVESLEKLRGWATERLTTREVNKSYYFPETCMDLPSGNVHHSFGNVIPYRSYGSGLKRN